MPRLPPFPVVLTAPGEARGDGEAGGGEAAGGGGGGEGHSTRPISTDVLVERGSTFRFALPQMLSSSVELASCFHRSSCGTWKHFPFCPSTDFPFCRSGVPPEAGVSAGCVVECVSGASPGPAPQGQPIPGRSWSCPWPCAPGLLKVNAFSNVDVHVSVFVATWIHARKDKIYRSADVWNQVPGFWAPASLRV